MLINGVGDKRKDIVYEMTRKTSLRPSVLTKALDALRPPVSEAVSQESFGYILKETPWTVEETSIR